MNCLELFFALTYLLRPLCAMWSIRTTTAQRSFFYRSINIWNSLSYSTNSESLSDFKHNIKRELFRIDFRPNWAGLFKTRLS